MRKIIGIHLIFVAISGLVLYFQFTGPYLIWNMFLALLALDFSFGISRVKKWFGFQLVFFLLWFFFYPNTFYMLTDLTHIHFMHRVLSNNTSLLSFTIYVLTILFGTFCGILSVRYIARFLKLKSFWLRYVSYLVLSVISSYAIHIGRYARLNSWDIVGNPMLVIKEMLSVFKQDSLVFILGFTALQLLCLIFMDEENTKS